MRKHTIVIEGNRLGAEFAVSAANLANLEDAQYRLRQDDTVMVWAYSHDTDNTARRRWVAECRKAGVRVLPAPWERGGKRKPKATPNTQQAAEAMRKMAGAKE